jgi:hypothetical protein
MVLLWLTDSLSLTQCVPSTAGGTYTKTTKGSPMDGGSNKAQEFHLFLSAVLFPSIPF